MRVHILSDLHLEHFNKPSDWIPPTVEADVLVLAGDIGVVDEPYIDWLSTVSKRYSAVVMVLGNHEYYQDGLTVQTAHSAWLNAIERLESVYCLQDDSVIIDNVRFIGSTLWTDYNIHGEDSRGVGMRLAEQKMNDHRRISMSDSIGERRFFPDDALSLHLSSRRYIEKTLTTTHSGPTVVVTHHAPHPVCIHPRYQNDLLTVAYASDLDELIKQHRPELWIHGHLHNCVDRDVHGTRIVCNPRGYPLDLWTPQNQWFKPDLVIPV